MTELEVLQDCKIEGTTVYLPDVQLDRKLYMQVSKALELIGGKWNRKVKGFVYKHDPTSLIEKLKGGEKVNPKKEFQFFATPKELCEAMVEMADIKESDIVLEPSAGQGAIVNAIHQVMSGKIVDCYEVMDINTEILMNEQPISFMGEDFLECKIQNFYTKIVANPPFAKNQDITHIRKMYDVLKPGGIIVTIASMHWTFAEEKKCVEFREWLDEIEAEQLDIEEGTFKQSGTNIKTKLLIINK